MGNISLSFHFKEGVTLIWKEFTNEELNQKEDVTQTESSASVLESFTKCPFLPRKVGQFPW